MKQIERELKSLGNKRRLEIILFIKKYKSPTVGSIVRHLKISFPATSRHLSILEKANILDKKQTSLEVRYFLSPDISELSQVIIDHLNTV